MLLKASDLRFTDAMRQKYFPLVIRASPPEGWPTGTIVVTESNVPYKGFLQAVGVCPTAEFRAEAGEYRDNDPRIALSMLEEIALNCPLKEEEAAAIRREYENASKEAGEERPPLFIQGLISSMFYALQSGLLSFSSALVLSLYAGAEVQREIVGFGLIDQSPEGVLEVFADPFFPGDILNRLAREPGRLKALGCDSLRAFLMERSPISYGRGRFLMRLAAAIPPENRAGLTSDQGELLLIVGKAGREALFGGKRTSIDGREIDFKEVVSLSRAEARRLIRQARKEKGGTQA